MSNLPKFQLGQALLIIVLIMFVGLTVSLTLISRTTTDIKLSRELEESSRALSAAEAGIEEALRDITIARAGPTPIPIGTATFTVESAPASGGIGVFSLGKIEKENVGTVWLANYNSGPGTFTQAYTANTISLCWKEADTLYPDIEAIILYQDGSVYKAARAFFDHSSLVGSGCGGPYSYTTDIDFNSLLSGLSGKTLLALRLKSINADAFVAVDPPEGVTGNSLPSQGTEIISTGKAGETIRKVRVIKSYPSWPEIFDYVLFSGGGLNK